MTETAALERLAAFEIETPSWGYGNSGTRFHVFPWPGAARTVWERIDDAALVHQLTGCCPSVALHIPWDRVDDWPALRDYASSRGIRIGADQPQSLRRGRLPARKPVQSGQSSPRAGARALPRVRRDRAGGRLHDHQPLVGRRHELSGSGRPARTGTRDSWQDSKSCTGCSLPACACSSNTSSSSPAFTAPTFQTGGRPRCSADIWVRSHRCLSTPATIRRERTSSRSWQCY